MDIFKISAIDYMHNLKGASGKIFEVLFDTRKYVDVNPEVVSDQLAQMTPPPNTHTP